jgi:hypothetical protein
MIIYIGILILISLKGGQTMRKVTRNTGTAFIAGVKCTEGNTFTDGKELLLHGNTIAWKNEDGDTFITCAGWNTNTTRERLNGLLEMLNSSFRVRSRDFEPHIFQIRETEEGILKEFKIDWLGDFASFNVTHFDNLVNEGKTVDKITA